MAAQKRIKIDLQFDANTSGAKAKINELSRTLDNLANATKKGELFDTKTLTDARIAALDLQKILKQVVNIDTGKFDVSKFNSNLKKSGNTLEDLRRELNSLGPAGEKTFTSLADAILAAETPTIRTNKLLKEMGITLANTVRWQLSSSLVSGFTNGLSQAVNYCEKLNQSINDIRIVTGYSAEQMNDFAVEANKAAKALSTTTNQYAKASLIYYQQGLSDEEVKARTEATIKMANVTGESASQVSSYMTGIWNNFYDGSRSLESYADVITKLGAATASSSEEIANGLQKFSAVADTVGLSYNYAATAMATVAAQTRESEDVIGTSFKSIFARLESLSLGETLEDNTTLTQYSKALATVGVSIKDENDNLRDMDDILDDLGERWQTISRSQQVALAQTVAGQRQYNNFIALLDNYDTFKINLEIADSSEGSLDAQAEIFADSWEAASNRVQASLETLYETLLDDDFFVGLISFGADFIEQINNVATGLGGLKGIAGLASTALLKIFGPQLAEGINNAVYSIRSLFGLTQKEITATKKQAAEALEQQKALTMVGVDKDSEQAKVIESYFGDITKLRQMLAEQDANLTEEQKNEIQNQIDVMKSWYEKNLELAKKIDESQKTIKEMADDIADTPEFDTKREQKAIKELEKDSTFQSLYKGSVLGKDVNQEEYMAKMLGFANKEDLTQGNNIAGILGDLVDRLVNRGLDEETYRAGVQEIIDGLKATEGKSLAQQERDLEIGAAVESFLSFGDKKGEIALKEGFTQPYIEDVRKAAVKANIKTSLQEGDGTNSVLAQAIKGMDSAEVDRLVGDLAEKLINVVTEQEKPKKENPEYTQKVAEKAAAEEDLKATQEEADKIKAQMDGISKKAKGDLQGIKISADDLGKSIVAIGTAASSVVTISANIKGLWDTISNPDTSGWEKMLAIFSSLSSTIFSVSSTLTAFKDIGSIASKALTAGTNALENASSKALTKQLEKETMQRHANADAMNREQREQVESIATDAAENASSKKGGFFSQLRDFGSAGKQYLGNGGLKSLGRGLFTKVLPIAIMVGSVAFAVNSITKTYNKAENAANNAKQSAEALNKAASASKENYNSITTLSKGYADASEKLKTLVKGTLEYSEALLQSNENAMALIEKYDGIEYTIEDGKINIGEESVLAVQEAQLKDYQNKMALADMEKVVSIDAEKTNTATQAVRKDSDYGIVAGTLGVAGGALAAILAASVTTAITGGAALPLWIAAAGTAGAALGTSGGVAGVQLKEEKRAETLEKIAELYEEDSTILEDLPSALRKEGVDFDSEYVHSLTENTTALKEQLEAINKNTAAQEAARQQAAYNANAGNKEFTESGFTGALSAFAANRAEEAEIKDYDDKDEVLKDLFGDDAKNYRIKNWGGGNVTLEEKDENGNWVHSDKYAEEDGNDRNDVSKKRLFEAASKAAAMRLDEDENENLVEDRVALYASWLKGFNLSAKDLDKRDAIATSLENGDKAVDLSTLSAGALGKIKINELPEDIRDSVALGIKNTQKAISETIKGYSNEVSSRLWGTDEFLNQEEIKNWGNTLASLGAKGGESSISSINTLAQNLAIQNPEKQAEIYKAISDIDWSNPVQGARDLQGKLYDLGIVIENNNGAWNQFESNISNLNISALAKDTKTWRTELAALNKVIKDVDFGSVVSDENYKTIVAANGELKKYFLMTAEGYKFIGDKEELSKFTSEAQQEDLLKMLDSQRKAVDGINWLRESRDTTYDQIGNLMSDSATGIDYFNAAEILRSTKEGQKLIEGLGYNVSEFISKESLARDGDEAAQEFYKGFWAKVSELNQKNESSDIVGETAELAMSTAENFEALNDAFKKAGKDTIAQYNKAYEALKKSSEELAEQVKLEYSLGQAIEKTEQAISRIAKLRDNAYGERYLRLAKEEAELQKSLSAYYSQKATAAKNEVNETLKTLKDLGIDAAVSDAGYVENYAAVSAQIKTKGISNGEDKLKELEDNLSNYRSYISQSTEALDGANTAVLEGLSRSLEDKLSSRELEKEIQDSLNSWMEDADFAQGMKVETLISDLEQKRADNNDRKNTLLLMAEEVLGSNARKYYASEEAFIAAAAQSSSTVKDLLDEYRKSEAEMVSDVYSATGDIISQLDELFQEVQEQYTDAEAQIQRVIALTETYSKIIDTVGKKSLGISNDTIQKLNNSILESRKASLLNTRDQITETQKTITQIENAVASGDFSGLDAKYQQMTEKQLQEFITKQKQSVQDMQNSLQSGLADTLQAAVDVYTQTLEMAAEEFSEKVAGSAGSLSWLSESYERQSDLSNQYLADYKKVYELSKLRRQIEKSIDNASNVKTQRNLRDLVREITNLESSGAKVSEYQLTMLQKRYDLKLAEANMEEGKLNSLQMALRRNASGGWSYEYTQAENAADALQGYSDALYNLADTNQSYIDEMQGSLISLEKEMSDKLIEIASDMSLSAEEREKRIDEVTAYYTERIKYHQSELQIAFADADAIYKADSAEFIANMELKKQWSDTIISELTGESGINAYFNTIVGETSNLVEGISDSFNAIFGDTGDSMIEQIFAAAGESLRAFNEDTLINWTQDVSETLSSLDVDTTQWEGSLDSITNIVSDWKERIVSIVGVAKSSINSIGEELKQAEQIKAIQDEYGIEKLNVSGFTTKKGISKANFANRSLDTANEKLLYWIQSGDDAATAIQKYQKEIASVKKQQTLANTIEAFYANKKQETKEEATIPETSYAQEDNQESPYFTKGEEESILSLYSQGPLPLNRLKKIQGVYKGARIYDYDESEKKYKSLLVGNPKQINQDLYIVGVFQQDGETLFSLQDANGNSFNVVNSADTFDTGGYTGAWGSEGRLAMLHQKELVLNSSDTENFLAGIKILRQVASAIDLRASAAQYSLGQLVSYKPSATEQTVQQEVTIHAEFPNATDHNEIEEAFNQLINQTAQFIHRN